ncbi:hypothetical protein M0R19_06405 [Candidatus Pacearchaeota archaeon]|nr:hypothetical protein [Candidatus Pacearchaeota archaeon]
MKTKKQFRKNWALGFLSLMAFQSIRYIDSKNWLDLLWILWIVWAVYFIPIKNKAK